MSDIDELLEEELKDPEFAQAWEETSLLPMLPSKTARPSGK